MTDDTAAIARGLADAKAKNVPLVIPVGQCNFSDIIRVYGAKIQGSGATSVLYATNWTRSAIFMYDAAPSISNVKLTGAAAPSRQAAWENTKITIFGATDFVIDHVTIEGSPAAGIQTAQGATRGRITNNTIRNTLSDSIHMTGGASQLLVEGNTIENSGDDGIAAVAYPADTVRVNNIEARYNIVRNNKFGRNMSVVGGDQVHYHHNQLLGNTAGLACQYFAQEFTGTSAFKRTTNVLSEYNTLQNCGSVATGHAAVMIYSDGAYVNDNIQVVRNDIIQNGSQTGFRYYGPQTNIRLDSNRISGVTQAYEGGADPDVTIIQYTGGAVGSTAP
jgi:hypothetical protein